MSRKRQRDKVVPPEIVRLMHATPPSPAKVEAFTRRKIGQLRQIADLVFRHT
jgi:hypothetical protein